MWSRASSDIRPSSRARSYRSGALRSLEAEDLLTTRAQGCPSPPSWYIPALGIGGGTCFGESLWVFCTLVPDAGMWGMQLAPRVLWKDRVWSCTPGAPRLPPCCTGAVHIHPGSSMAGDSAWKLTASRNKRGREILLLLNSSRGEAGHIPSAKNQACTVQKEREKGRKLLADCSLPPLCPAAASALSERAGTPRWGGPILCAALIN